MNEEQYKKLFNAFLGLKGVHEEARLFKKYDFQALNYYADIIEEAQHLFKDFEEVKNHILEEINVQGVSKRFII